MTTKRSFKLSTDSDLLTRMAKEDEIAWREFHTKYRNMIIGIGKKRGISQEETEDLIQEVMLVCCQRISQFTYDRTKGHFRSYLTAIIRNVAAQMRRTKKNEPIPVPEYDDEIDKLFMKQYEDFLVENLLKKLKERVNSQTYSAFEMLHLQQLPIEEVCQITGKSASALYLIRSRCFRILRQCIVEIPEAVERLRTDENSSKNI